jgi:hypothetical protein
MRWRASSGVNWMSALGHERGTFPTRVDSQCRHWSRSGPCADQTIRPAPADQPLYRSKLVLVRPDQHIAWHGDSADDAEAVIGRVRGAT